MSMDAAIVDRGRCMVALWQICQTTQGLKGLALIFRPLNCYVWVTSNYNTTYLQSSKLLKTSSWIGTIKFGTYYSGYNLPDSISIRTTETYQKLIWKILLSTKKIDEWIYQITELDNFKIIWAKWVILSQIYALNWNET